MHSFCFCKIALLIALPRIDQVLDQLARRRAWLGEPCRIAARLLDEACRAAVPGARLAFIEFVQIFGDLVNFYPRVHMLAAGGVLRADGVFVELPPIPEALLASGFRRAVLDFLLAQRAVSEKALANTRSAPRPPGRD